MWCGAPTPRPQAADDVTVGMPFDLPGMGTNLPLVYSTHGLPALTLLFVTCPVVDTGTFVDIVCRLYLNRW